MQQLKRYWPMILMVAVLVAMVPGLAYAQEPVEESPETLIPYVVTLAPGEDVEVPVNGFCLNRGLPFPGDSLAPLEAAPDAVQTAIGYIITNKYQEEATVYQAQLAVWNLLDGLKPEGVDHSLADEIIDYAKVNKPPHDDVEAMTLADAVAAGVVTAAVSDYENTSPPGHSYFGSGTLTVTNISDESQTVMIPYGTRFEDTTQEGTQDMSIFPDPRFKAPERLPETGAAQLPLNQLWVIAGVTLLLIGVLLRYRAPHAKNNA